MKPEPLSRERIVAAAVDLIEREGADAVSMRRIATELGVGVMSLYNHVPNKSSLLDGVAESVMAQIEFHDDISAPWQEQVLAQARALRQIAMHYPRCTLVVLTRQLRTPAGLLPTERALATLKRAGFERDQAVSVLRAFVAYIVGCLLREVGVTSTFDPAGGGGSIAGSFDATLFPETADLYGWLATCDHEAEFEFGLRMLVEAAAVVPRAPSNTDEPQS
ncbi:TetR/AcrR family transcriptional regulator [Sinosporangium siamense]|uniref:TetR family transcriptional regulator n=2 Tax=Sinosporangium siamense TaxID=1367973 RepID=A0A919V4S7_9ACTN|nr:TetR/AcrR family transcriptional regulator C-terminal domain-containing protein [Sinosporangium siamense]GII92235.1 TetR family transcriptional regulator [Sinosporangium siamense]